MDREGASRSTGALGAAHRAGRGTRRGTPNAGTRPSNPDNRVVARATLEGEWERCLRELEQVRADYERAKREQRVELTERDRERIPRALSRSAQGLEVVNHRAAGRPCKAMLRLVIEAVSLRAVEVPCRETLVRSRVEEAARSPELRVPEGPRSAS